eukprot:341444-Chlamydomonas_euryale.AAC.2
MWVLRSCQHTHSVWVSQPGFGPSDPVWTFPPSVMLPLCVDVPTLWISHLVCADRLALAPDPHPPCAPPTGASSGQLQQRRLPRLSRNCKGGRAHNWHDRGDPEAARAHVSDGSA